METSRVLWRRQESRPVRPFRFAEDYLKDVGIRLYAEEEFRTSESIQISAVDRERLAIQVKIAPTPNDFESVVGVPSKSMRLVVTIEDRTFKNSIVFANIPLSDVSDDGKILTVEDEEGSISWEGETRLHVAVVLSEPRKGQADTAQRVGSWLARKTFVIGTPRDTSTFTINAVEPEYFTKRGLPAATTYFVEVQDPDLNQSCENLPDLVKVSLASNVHAALARDQESSMAKALIKAIYIDVVTTVLATGYSNLQAGAKIVEDSIMDVVTTKLMKSTGVSAERLRVFASETAGSQLRAVVQSEIELSHALVSAMQRR
jgi:hypothetical protein